MNTFLGRNSCRCGECVEQERLWQQKQQEREREAQQEAERTAERASLAKESLGNALTMAIKDIELVHAPLDSLYRQMVSEVPLDDVYTSPVEADERVFNALALLEDTVTRLHGALREVERAS